MADTTPLRQVLADCRRLLSVRGEANGPLSIRAAGTPLEWDTAALRRIYYDAIPRRMRGDADRT